MEAKLAEYRQKKAKSIKPGLLSYFRRSKQGNIQDPNASGTADKCQHDVSTEIVSDQNPEITDTKRKSNLEDYTTPSEQYVKSYKVIWIERILKFLLWLLLWLFFIEYQFGVAYFITSLIVIVYLNTRTGPRDRRHLSAYSVFNPNFERIDGTFTAEQFEKELIYGAGSVKKDYEYMNLFFHIEDQSLWFTRFLIH